MREIKFRAWDKRSQKMIDHCVIIPIVDGTYWIYKAGFNQIGTYEGGISVETQFEISDYIPMQYTGLKDKNGVEIYEGDIILETENIKYRSEIVTYKHIVEWSDEHCGFAPFADYDSDCGIFTLAQNCQVIGNIYENPELLEKENKHVN